MRHKYFRFLACVAMVLVTSMVLAIPASAAQSSIDLSGYLLNTENGGAFTNYEYLYSGSTKAGSNTTYAYFSSNSSNALAGSAPYEVTTSKEYDSLRFKLGYTKSAQNHFTTSWSNSQYFKVSGIHDIDDFSGVSVRSAIVLHASAPVSCKVTFYVHFYNENYSGCGTYKQEFSLSLNGTNYYDLSADVDCSPSSNALYFDCLWSIEYLNVSSGTFISVAQAPVTDSYDDLSLGFRYVVRSEKTIDIPSFSKNLSSSISKKVGESNIALTVSASVSDGGSVTYQWFRGSSADSAVEIPGATSQTFMIETIEEIDSYYYCVATNNLYGLTKSARSAVCHVTVIKPPVAPMITQDVSGGGIIEYVQGAAANSLIVRAIITDNGTLSYQWYSNSSESDTGGTYIPGATSTSYVPSTGEVGLRYYYCVVTNTKAGYTATTTSSVIGIRVVPPPDPAKAPVIDVDLDTEPVKYKEGTAAAPLRIGASSPDGGVLSYQWYKITDGTPQALPGEIYASFTPDTVNVGTFYYYCIITNTLNETNASITSATATVVIEPDRTDSLLDTIIGGISDLIDGIMNLPQMIIDGIKNLFIPDPWTMAEYQVQWEELLASRFGAIYEAMMLIDEFGDAISAQSAQGIVTFPEVTLNLAGAPWTFGGWDVKIIPDGFGGVVVVLKSAVNIVCTFAFVNGLRRRFEGIMGGA